ncbi:palmdelphin-like [Centropristis striata]|uniref:palmdelphin-like n=1 Tax=Centropristis striata TaxID=184440 RepID=UPI0027DF924E|nr:palmdelphin-like [Centropristis striata]
MEESGLLKERLHAITEKHRIQEDIRRKKLELDQEKLKLQHLKKKSLKEQWLLQDSASHNATEPRQQQNLLSDQQKTRELQLSIHRIETEVEFLEREESGISTKESFILTRLKAIEKSPGDIIKEAQDSSVPEPSQVTTVNSDVPECFTPPANKHFELNTAQKTLFAMEVNVSKNLLTGKSSVLSTATVPPEEIYQHTGLKVYEDDRKCVYALNSQEGSHSQSCVSELSANEVEHLLKSATVHRQVNHQNYQNQNHCRRKQQCFSNHQEYDRVEELDLRNQRGSYDKHLLKSFSFRENCQRRPAHYCHQESQNRWQEKRNNQSNLRESNYGNQKNGHCSSYQLVRRDGPASHHTGGIFRSNSVVNSSRANERPPPRSHDQEAVSAYQPQLCYTPASYIPLNDYISVDEEELYCYSHDGKPPTAQYSEPHHFDTVPSPLFADDTPYSILNAMETSEPITAIFMGFQTTQNDSGEAQEFEGSLKAEIVVIGENEDNDEDDNSVKEKKNYVQLGGVSYPAASSSNGNLGRLEGVGDRRTVRRGPGIRKIQKKSKPCCSVC